MNQDISASRQKALAEVTKRFTDAVRENQTATDLFDEALSQFLGINRTDGRCLDIIDRLGRVSAGQLAIESGLTTGAVTAVIDRLEKAGYVARARDTLDRRKVWVETTESMRTITAHIFSLHESIGSIMARFTPDQLKAIMEFLQIERLISQEMTAGIREHASAAATTTEARLAQAMLFEKAMAAMMPRLRKQIDAIDVDLKGLD